MHAKFVTFWWQVVQPMTNVHDTKWTPHVKRQSDVAQSYTSSAITSLVLLHGSFQLSRLLRDVPWHVGPIIRQRVVDT